MKNFTAKVREAAEHLNTLYGKGEVTSVYVKSDRTVEITTKCTSCLPKAYKGAIRNGTLYAFGRQKQLEK